jgi:hypothetical protein
MERRPRLTITDEGYRKYREKKEFVSDTCVRPDSFEKDRPLIAVNSR